MKLTKDLNINSIHGVLQIIVSVYFINENVSLYNFYWNSGLLFITMIPKWVLILNIMFGVLGVIIGFFNVLNKFNVILSYLVIITLWVISFFIT